MMDQKEMPALLALPVLKVFKLIVSYEKKNQTTENQTKNVFSKMLTVVLYEKKLAKTFIVTRRLLNDTTVLFVLFQ